MDDKPSKQLLPSKPRKRSLTCGVTRCTNNEYNFEVSQESLCESHHLPSTDCFLAKNLTGDFFYRLLSMKTVKNTTGKQDNGIFWKIIYLFLEIICDNSFSSK